MINRRFLVIAGAITLVAVGGIYWLYQNSNQGDKTATITVTAAPSDSGVKINGGSAQLGANSVSPGRYVVTISRSGFASVTKTIDVASGQNALVGFALAPNSSKTADWYQTHPDDTAIAQKITDPKYNSSIAVVKNPQPFTDLLPYVAGGFEFTVAEDPDPDNINNPLIWIEGDTPQAQQDALTWIKNQGYDPSKMNLKYSTTTDPNRP